MHAWEYANKYVENIIERVKQEPNTDLASCYAKTVGAMNANLNWVFMVLEQDHPEAFQTVLKELKL